MGWEGNTGLFTGHGPARGSGDEVFQNSRAESGRVRRCSELSRVGVGLGRVGAGGFQISRVGPGHTYPTRSARRDSTRESGTPWKNVVFDGFSVTGFHGENRNSGGGGYAYFDGILGGA